MEILEEDRLLFMRYALPCAGTLIMRGSIDKDTITSLITAVKRGESIPSDSEKIFKVALSACSLIALDRHKPYIDKDIILDYYRFFHDSVIDRRYEEMGDFDPRACRVRSGTVVSTDLNFAMVKNSLGTFPYRTDFVPDLKKDDLVVTHWDFIVERIDLVTFQKMNLHKEALHIR